MRRFQDAPQQSQLQPVRIATVPLKLFCGFLRLFSGLGSLGQGNDLSSRTNLWNLEPSAFDSRRFPRQLA